MGARNDFSWDIYNSRVIPFADTLEQKHPEYFQGLVNKVKCGPVRSSEGHDCGGHWTRGWMYVGNLWEGVSSGTDRMAQKINNLNYQNAQLRDITNELLKNLGISSTADDLIGNYHTRAYINDQIKAKLTKSDDYQNIFNQLNSIKGDYNAVNHQLHVKNTAFTELNSLLAAKSTSYDKLSNQITGLQGDYSELQKSHSELERKYSDLLSHCSNNDL